MKPNLTNVLAAIRRGRVVRLDLNPEQKRALRDRDGQIALNVLRHACAARATAAHGNARPDFPLTETFVTAVARKLDTPIGQKRARAMIHRLAHARVTNYSGSYRQRYGAGGEYRVRTYRLAARVRAVTAVPPSKHPVGTRAGVKGVGRSRWWRHPLFGTFDGLPPPQLSWRERRAWRSADERMATWR